MALKRIWLPSPSYSVGRSSKPRLLVLHTAEGSRTIESLGGWFANPANKVSSHAGADDTPYTIGVYVKRENRAWTQANANATAVSIELCGFSAWSAEEWAKHPNMLANCAAWLKEEATFFDIPLVRLTPDQARNDGRGVCQHVDLGYWGGNHSDIGGAFPMDMVIQMARGDFAPAEPIQIWHFIQDITASRLARGQRSYYGGWPTTAGRDKMVADLTRGFNHPFRAFNDRDFKSPFFIDNSGYVKEVYGGWSSAKGRDAAMKDLEAQLGRRLRPFSERRTAAQGGVPWGCRNLVAP